MILKKISEKRKTLIACIIAEKKFNKAQLALDLLQNDSQSSLSYIRTVRSFLDEPALANLFIDKKNEDIKNFKIMSLSNYDIAKKVFLKIK